MTVRWTAGQERQQTCLSSTCRSHYAELSQPRRLAKFGPAKSSVSAAKFDAAVAKIPNGAGVTDIERLLTQCKLYVALYGDEAGAPRVLAEFEAE